MLRPICERAVENVVTVRKQPAVFKPVCCARDVSRACEAVAVHIKGCDIFEAVGIHVRQLPGQPGVLQPPAGTERRWGKTRSGGRCVNRGERRMADLCSLAHISVMCRSTKGFVLFAPFAYREDSLTHLMNRPAAGLQPHGSCTEHSSVQLAPFVSSQKSVHAVQST